MSQKRRFDLVETIIKRIDIILMALILLFFAIYIQGITQPFGYSRGVMDAGAAIYAKNFIFYGFQSGVMPYHGFYNGAPVYYANHPFLIPLLVYISFLAFGISEWSARLVPLFFSLMTFIYLFKIADRYWGRKAAYYTVFTYLVMPILAHYGKMICFEPVLTTFMLAAIYYYGLWLEKKDGRYLCFMIFSIFFGTLVDYSLLFICLIMTLHALVAGKNIREKMNVIMAIDLPMVAGFALFIWQLLMVGRSGAPVSGFLVWAHYKDVLLAPYFYFVMIKRLIGIFNPVVFLLFLLWLKGIVNKKTYIYGDWTVLFVLFVSIATIIIAPKAILISSYMLYYLAIAFAMIAGIELSRFQVRTGIIMIVLMGLLSIPAMVRYYSIEKSLDYKAAGMRIAPLLNDRTLLIGPLTQHIYYSGARNIIGEWKLLDSEGKHINQDMMNAAFKNAKYNKIVIMSSVINDKIKYGSYKVQRSDKEFLVLIR